jgi:hypothetical protein
VPPSPSLGVSLPTAWSNNNAFNKPKMSVAVLVLVVLAVAYARLVDGEPQPFIPRGIGVCHPSH